jgi:hypothetical protein
MNLLSIISAIFSYRLDAEERRFLAVTLIKAAVHEARSPQEFNRFMTSNATERLIRKLGIEQEFDDVLEKMRAKVQQLILSN